MRKILLCTLPLFATLFIASAQVDHTYLRGQRSPFSGDFSEPRYQNVDSMETVHYVDNRMTGEANPSTYSFEEIPGFFTLRSYTLIKQSPDGLVDTFEYLSRNHTNELFVRQNIKKYSTDGKLIYTAPFADLTTAPAGFFMAESQYVYDTNGRIQETNYKEYYKSIDDNSIEIRSEGYTKYDYENNIIINSNSKVPLTYILYTDNGYITKQQDYYYDNKELVLVSDSVIAEYIFDTSNRLIREERYSPHISFLDPGYEIIATDTTIVEYKYTTNGYERYENGVKKESFAFQQDGYCTEIIGYRPYNEYLDGEEADPNELYINSITKYAYFKNGQEVSNGPIESASPKAFGTQGGIMIDLEKATAVTVYTVAGSLVRKSQMDEGKTTISLPKGIYIVAIGNLSYKVLVR